jgi:sugar phosphate isomerase/epimerase
VRKGGPALLHLGLVTYNLARDWDLETLIARAAEAGFEGVELRTTHAHGVEPDLDREHRARIRRRFAAAPVRLVGLGTVCEYHAVEPEVVRANVEATKRWVDLAADLGCPGVKVRPNGHQEARGIPRAETLRQIGRALAECAEYAERRGVELRLEMHGSVAAPPDIAAIVRYADHPRLRVCWNSNPEDVRDGSVAWGFGLLADRIGMVHITELWNRRYPYRELFRLLKASGYRGFCLAEIPESPEPLRLMRYYRALWCELAGEGPAP